MRYWDIAERLREDIKKGIYKLGDRLPTEEQLGVAFGVGRYTTRQAVGLLADEGMVTRRTRAGSVVIALSPQTHYAQCAASVHELINYPAATIRKTLASGYVTVDHEEAELLRCGVGDSWFRLQSLRFSPDSQLPICYTQIYILPEYAGIIKHRKHDRIPIADQITEMYGIEVENAEMEVSASLVTESSSRLLKVPSGSAALTTVRRYARTDGTVFEVSRAVHPASRYTYSVQLRREAKRTNDRPQRLR